MNNEGKSESLELLLKNIFDLVEKLEKHLENLDEKTRKEFEELKKQLETFKEIAEHHDLIETLGNNVSPEGLKTLLEDCTLNTDFRKKYDDIMDKIEKDTNDNSDYRKKSEETKKLVIKIIGWGLAVGVPIMTAMLGLGIWMLQTYFFKASGGS